MNTNFFCQSGIATLSGQSYLPTVVTIVIILLISTFTLVALVASGEGQTRSYAEYSLPAMNVEQNAIVCQPVVLEEPFDTTTLLEAGFVHDASIGWIGAMYAIDQYGKRAIRPIIYPKPRMDVDGSGAVNISDVTLLVSCIFTANCPIEE